MSNAQYLFLSYLLVSLAAVGLSWVSFQFLKGPFLEALGEPAMAPLRRILGRFLRPGLIMIGLAGFASVSYRSCMGPKTYVDIIAERSYLVFKTHEQLTAIFEYLSYAVVAWATLLALALCIARNSDDVPQSGDPHESALGLLHGNGGQGRN